MQSTAIDPRLVKTLGIKEKKLKEWEELFLEIENLNENRDKNSAIAGYIQLLNDLGLFEFKKKKFLKSKLKEYINSHK